MPLHLYRERSYVVRSEVKLIPEQYGTREALTINGIIPDPDCPAPASILGLSTLTVANEQSRRSRNLAPLMDETQVDLHLPSAAAVLVPASPKGMGVVQEAESPPWIFIPLPPVSIKRSLEARLERGRVLTSTTRPLSYTNSTTDSFKPTIPRSSMLRLPQNSSLMYSQDEQKTLVTKIQRPGPRLRRTDKIWSLKRQSQIAIAQIGSSRQNRHLIHETSRRDGDRGCQILVKSPKSCKLQTNQHDPNRRTGFTVQQSDSGTVEVTDLATGTDGDYEKKACSLQIHDWQKPVELLRNESVEVFDLTGLD